MLLSYTDIPFDKYGRPEQPELHLETLGEDVIGTIPGVHNLKLNVKFAEPSIMEFDVPAVIGGQDNWIYDKLTGYKIIYTDVYGVYVTMNPEESSDGIEDIKHITAYSIEKLLDTKKFFIEEGTFKFYNLVNPYDTDTIIGRILEIATDWRVGYVAQTVAQRYRTFDQYDDYLASFMYGDAQEKFRCIFVFEPYAKTINVYDADEEIEHIPIYLDFDNLLNEVDLTEINDDLVTAMRPYGADGLNIIDVNPIGSQWIYDLSFFISNGDISEELAGKWNGWNADIEANRSRYQSLIAVQSSLTSKLLTEQAKKTDLDGKMESLKAQQSVYIQQYAMEYTEDGREAMQEELDSVNVQIAAVQEELDSLGAQIEATRGELEAYGNEIAEIVSTLSFNTTESFSDDDRKILRKYMIEQDMTEETFVATDVQSGVHGTMYDCAELSGEGSITTYYWNKYNLAYTWEKYGLRELPEPIVRYEISDTFDRHPYVRIDSYDSIDLSNFCEIGTATYSQKQSGGAHIILREGYAIFDNTTGKVSIVNSTLAERIPDAWRGFEPHNVGDIIGYIPEIFTVVKPGRMDGFVTYTEHPYSGNTIDSFSPSIEYYSFDSGWYNFVFVKSGENSCRVLMSGINSYDIIKTEISVEKGEYIEDVSSESVAAYPNNGPQRDYWYVYSGDSGIHAGGWVGSINSTSEEAYPQDGEQDGYWYIFDRSVVSSKPVMLSISNAELTTPVDTSGTIIPVFDIKSGSVSIDRDDMEGLSVSFDIVSAKMVANNYGANNIDGLTLNAEAENIVVNGESVPDGKVSLSAHYRGSTTLEYEDEEETLLTKISYAYDATQGMSTMYSLYVENGKGGSGDYIEGLETVSVTGSKIEKVQISLGNNNGSSTGASSSNTKDVYIINGGYVNLLGQHNFYGDIILSTLEVNPDNKFTMSIRTGRISTGTASAMSGMVTINGVYDSLTTDVHAVTVDEVTTYEGTYLTIVIQKADMFLSSSVSEYQKYTVQMELYQYAKAVLSDYATPTYEFDVSSGNFIFAREFEPFRKSLQLGKGIYLNLGHGETINPYIIEFEIGFEDESDFSLIFSNRFKRHDHVSTLSDMVEKGYSSGRSLDANKYIYGQAVGQASQVSEFMSSALDTARNTIIGAENQSVVIDGSGINVSDPDAPNYQLRIVNNMIALTDNSWETAKLAIGRFRNLEENTSNGSGGVLNLLSDVENDELASYFGVNAEVVAGKLIVGNNLIIENKTDEGAMQFKVDSSGAWLNNSTFILQDSGEEGQILIKPGVGIASGKGIYTTSGTTVTPDIYDDNHKIKDEVKFLLNSSTGDAYFAGELQSKSGKIGGFTIGDNQLSSGSGNTFVALNSSSTSSSNYAMWAGANTASSAPFSVKRDGSFYAGGNAVFSGTVRGAAFKDSGGNNMMSFGQFTGNYLNLIGTNVQAYDSSERKYVDTFDIDGDGNVTFRGTIVASTFQATDTDANTYSLLTADSMEFYVDGVQKISIDYSQNTSVAGVTIGNSAPIVVKKYFVQSGAHHNIGWIGDSDETCGIKFDLTNGKYNIYGVLDNTL